MWRWQLFLEYFKIKKAIVQIMLLLYIVHFTPDIVQDTKYKNIQIFNFQY